MAGIHVITSFEIIAIKVGALYIEAIAEGRHSPKYLPSAKHF